MKTLFPILVVLFSLSLNAQQPLDTIYANNSKNVALFFPKPIRQGITGADNFVFTYNREKEQYFGLLQAQPGNESNLLIITNGGQVYSYILKYADELPKLNYFIPNEESIGNEKPIKSIIDFEEDSSEIHKKHDSGYEKFCNYLLNSKFDRHATSRKKGVKLQLQKVTYQGSEVYLVLEVQNKSHIDFEIDYLSISVVNGNIKRKSSFQANPIDPLFKYKMPNVIKKGLQHRFVVVLPKFVLGGNEKLEVRLKEFRGNRYLKLNTRIN
ncbi:MAG: DUF4138 domain-containing protein [Ignavibacteriae bacterium]|jgi:hypothetical protein|nr:DUF4138 domain-containing protein [Ignavibacteriota bacterium]